MAFLVQFLRQLSLSASRQYLRRCWGVLLVMLAFTAGADRAFGQTVSREYQLKAVLLYNLTQFVEWPGSAFPTNGSPLVIGVLGVDPFGVVLDGVVRGEKSNNRQIIVKRFKTVEEAKNCQMLFISSSEKDNLRKILSQLKGGPVLTIADFDGFTKAGGMIHFFKNPDDKIKLKINSAAAKPSGIVLSAKLLRVADIVHPATE